MNKCQFSNADGFCGLTRNVAECSGGEDERANCPLWCIVNAVDRLESCLWGLG